MTDVIESCGGEELEWLGDGVLAAFQSAADAVRGAIRIQQTTRRPASGSKFEIRMGLHLGELLRREGGYFGTPIVTARRLCDRASSGQILCSRIIADLLSSRPAFGFRDLGDWKLKGLVAPVGVCEAIYERNDPVALLNHTPFVGRVAQLKKLSAKLDESSHGRGAIAMLRGEPGIGKTRMLEEFAIVARERGATVLCGSCYDGEWQPPYGPFAEVIAEYARVAQPAEFAVLLGTHAAILARIAPVLRETLGDIAEPVALDKEEERLRLFDALAQVLIDASRQAPLVLVLDDLHWADRGTVAMLNHVASFVGANPILLIGAYRDAEVNRTHPLSVALAGISRLRDSETIALKGLHSDELGSLLEMIGDQDAPESLIEALGDATDGNPLFIREVLLHLVEEGKIPRDGEGWTSKLSVEELGLPEGVRQVIGRRLLRLSKDANRLLSVASAFNGAFSFDVATAAAGLDEQAALSAIDEALDAQLLRPGTNSESFDFSHALIRHTLYSELNPARRVRMHRQIAEEMERAWGERASEHAAEVAYQFWRGAGGSGELRGADYAIAAADNAEAAYDHHEVVAFLRIALELMAHEDPRRLRVLARQAVALAWTANEDEAIKIAREAGAMIAAREGDRAAADYYDQIARTMCYAGIVSAGWQLAGDGLRLIGDRRDLTWASLREIDIGRREAEDPNNPGIRIDSHENRELYAVLKDLRGEQLRIPNFDASFDSRTEINQDPAPTPTALLMLAGDFRRSLPLQQQEAVQNEQHGAIAKATSAWADVARCHIALGDFNEGRAALDRAAKLSARMTTNSVGLLSLVAARGEFLYAIDEGWEGLLTDAAASVFVQSPGLESKWASAMINAYVSYLFARINQPDLAMQRVNLLPAALELGAPWARTYCPTACIAAATLWMLDRTDHVEPIERSIRAKVLAPDFRSPMSDSRLSLARLCALQGRHEEACEWFAKAREVLDEQGARPLRAIADYDQALMYRRRDSPGDAEKSRPFLEAATRQFNLLGMTGWLRHAEEEAHKDIAPTVTIDAPRLAGVA